MNGKPVQLSSARWEQAYLAIRDHGIKVIQDAGLGVTDLIAIHHACATLWEGQLCAILAQKYAPKIQVARNFPGLKPGPDGGKI